MDDPSAGTCRAVLALLQDLVRERLARKPGGHLIEPGLREMRVDATVGLIGPAAEPERFAERLTAAIDAHLDHLIEHAAAFRPGHAYCYRCASPRCEHSVSPSARHVLANYGPTGAPRWVELPQLALAQRHPEVDRLYDDPPAFVTIVVDASTLHADLLSAFRHPTYRLLGQLAAGYFGVPTREHEGRGVVALTFQVGATRGTRGEFRLGLNVVGRPPGEGELASLWERQPDLPWRPAVRWAQGALTTFGTRSDADFERLAPRVEGVLRGLARRLEHAQRSRGRRTRHADDRHASGTRPTRMAVEDARSAGAGSVMVDDRQGTTVVLGERGRTHFFSAEGLLVSSVRYSRPAIQRRRKLGVWRDATESEVRALQERLPAGRP